MKDMRVILENGGKSWDEPGICVVLENKDGSRIDLEQYKKIAAALGSIEETGPPSPVESAKKPGELEPFPFPEPGEVYRHNKTGHHYTIFLVDVEGAGQLRHAVPNGNFHIYKCLESGKWYARATAYWENERHSFIKLPVKNNVSFEIEWEQ